MKLKNMLTKNIISREEALKLAPDYVAFAEGDFNAYDKIIGPFSKLKKGASVITLAPASLEKVYSVSSKNKLIAGVYVKAKVASKKPGFEGEPEVRVSNGEYSWRVDGSKYAYPVSP